VRRGRASRSSTGLSPSGAAAVDGDDDNAEASAPAAAVQRSTRSAAKTGSKT
jgi:hypothetical protein